MYAVIEHGGKQYKVAAGDNLNIELPEIAPDAQSIEFDKVLFIGDEGTSKVGAPYLAGAKVVASFKTTAEEALFKGKKLFPMYFRRRKDSQRRTGHRQKYLQVTIETIQG